MLKVQGCASSDVLCTLACCALASSQLYGRCWPHLQAENERVTQQLVEVTTKLGSMQMELTVAQHRSREASLRSAGKMEAVPGDAAAAGVSASLALGGGEGRAADDLWFRT